MPIENANRVPLPIFDPSVNVGSVSKKTAAVMFAVGVGLWSLRVCVPGLYDGLILVIPRYGGVV